MPLKYLISWIGRQDLDGCKRQPASGPIVGTPHLAEVEIPFDLTLDVLPDLAARRAALLAPSDAQLPPTNAFDALIHQSAAMAAVIRDARRAALYPNSALILGESGTGKELLARAIRAASLRAGKP